MNSSKNTLALQDELKASINKSSVNEGREVEDVINYPVVSTPLKTIKNKEGHFDIVDEAGNVVGRITATLFGLGEKVVDTVVDVSKSIVNTTGNIINTGTRIVENIGSGIINTGSDIIKTSADTVEKTSNSLLCGTSKVLSNGISSGSDLISTSVHSVEDVSNSLLDGTSKVLSSGVSSGSDLISTGVHSVENISTSILSGTSKVLSSGVSAGTGLVNNSVSAVQDVSNNLIKGTSNVITGSVDNLRHSILQSESNPSTIEHVDSLKQATDVLHEELSKPVPDAVSVKLASEVLKSKITSEITNNNTTNSVKESAQQLQTVLQDDNADYESLKEATITLKNELEDTGNSIISTINSIGHSIINTGKSITTHVVDGVESVVTTVKNVGSDVVSSVTGKPDEETTIAETETGNSIIKSIKQAGQETVRTVKSALTMKCKVDQTGGVSVLNIANDTDVRTRMLITNNFLESKHVYFVRYHNNGTNVYDYKLNMKGGKVDKLELKSVNTLWSNGKIVESVSNNTFYNSIKILNNVIADLSKSSQVGGYVRKRVADKDAYYNEYKNYKLKYMSLKK